MREYPDGAIKSYEDLCNADYGDVYEASRYFRMVSEPKRILGLTFACMRDMNIPKNGYNDWFLFVDKDKAIAYSKS